MRASRRRRGSSSVGTHRRFRRNRLGRGARPDDVYPGGRGRRATNRHHQLGFQPVQLICEGRPFRLSAPPRLEANEPNKERHARHRSQGQRKPHLHMQTDDDRGHHQSDADEDRRIPVRRNHRRRSIKAFSSIWHWVATCRKMRIVVSKHRRGTGSPAIRPPVFSPTFHRPPPRCRNRRGRHAPNKSEPGMTPPSGLISKQRQELARAPRSSRPAPTPDPPPFRHDPAPRQTRIEPLFRCR